MECPISRFSLLYNWQQSEAGAVSGAVEMFVQPEGKQQPDRPPALLTG